MYVSKTNFYIHNFTGFTSYQSIYSICTGIRGEEEIFCTELTTITQDMLDRDGVSLKEACNILVNDYNSKKRVWASFGNYDRTMFQKDCKLHGLKYPFGKKHVNVKTWFALKERLTSEMGMARGLKHLGLELEGTHHRGVDDAYNIAKLLAHCLG